MNALDVLTRMHAPAPRPAREQPAAIRTHALTKHYGDTLALDTLNLVVRTGEVYGYLGPNGAGKTTTIRLLLGLHRPSAGRAEVFGIDAWNDPIEAHRRLAYVPGEPFLWPALTGTETLAYLARLHGSTDVAYRDLLVERCKLDTSKKVRALSKGNRQKVQLIAAFATRADLLILDEPTSGLDPLMEMAFRETVLEAKRRGQTVFLSSHILLRVVADTSAPLAWLRWATPLGWSEELRAFTGARPAVLVLPLLAGTALLAGSGMIAARRDIGSGLLAARDSAQPRLRLLSSPTAPAPRGARGSLLAWLAGIATFALVVGALATTVTTATLSSSPQEQIGKIGGATIATASGYIGLTFLFFVLALSLFACSQVAAARREEADQRLETLFALPAGRRGWLGGRLALGAAATTVLALAAGTLAWAGAASQDTGVSLPQLIGAGMNSLPAALLFGAVGALAFGALPRASVGIAYGLVAVAFVWELVGALLGAPDWALGLSPFHHVGLVPAQPFQAGGAAVMVALAMCAALAAVWAFARRDLTAA